MVIVAGKWTAEQGWVTVEERCVVREEESGAKGARTHARACGKGGERIPREAAKQRRGGAETYHDESFKTLTITTNPNLNSRLV